MIIFTNNNSTKFCQITLRINLFIDKRKVVPFSASQCIYISATSTVHYRCHCMIYRQKMLRHATAC